MNDVLRRVNEILAAILKEQGIDGRTCYTQVSALPPDGAAVEVECSDAAVAGELRRRVASDSGTTAVVVAVLPHGDLPPSLVAASPVVDVRRSPAHTAELVSQAVYGDAVLPLKTEGDWFLVRMDDGYLGWIRSWHLTRVSLGRLEEFRAGAGHRVAVNHATAYQEPSARALPVSSLVVGTPVRVEPGAPRGWVKVELPDGKVGFTRKADLEKRPAGRRATPARLVATGLRFLGIPYLWGGTTPAGFDCSGLIQRIFRLNGMLLPRDSDMQARFGREVETGRPDALIPGHLVFFGRSDEAITHVGLVLPYRQFLHAYGQVRVNSLDKKSEGFDPRLASIWRQTRDPLAGEPVSGRTGAIDRPKKRLTGLRRGR